MHKLLVIISPATGDSQSLANNGNCLLIPQGTPCSLLYGAPCPMVVSIVSKEGQSTVNVGGAKALGADCEFMCPMGGKLSAQSHGQSKATHNTAAAKEVASFIADFIPIVGTIKSVIEVVTGVDPITGEPTSRLAAAAGIVPGGKAISKGGKVIKAIAKGEKGAAKAAVKTAAKTEKVAASSTKAASKGEKAAAKNSHPPGSSPKKPEQTPKNAANNSNSQPKASNGNKPPPRTEPKNLEEKLALDEAKNGAGNKIKGFDAKQNDPRYPPDKWSKMEHTHKRTDGRVSITEGPNGEIVKSSKHVETIDIHFWENTQTGQRHGFKFKNP